MPLEHLGVKRKRTAGDGGTNYHWEHYKGEAGHCHSSRQSRVNGLSNQIHYTTTALLMMAPDYHEEDLRPQVDNDILGLSTLPWVGEGVPLVK